MQSWQESYEKIFGEMKNLLAELAEAESYEALLDRENAINALYQKFAFLKISRSLESQSAAAESLQISDEQSTYRDDDSIVSQKSEKEDDASEIISHQAETHDLFEDVPEVEEVHSFAEIDAAENLAEEISHDGQPSEDMDTDEDLESSEVHTTGDLEELISEEELENVEAQHFHEDIVEAVEEIEAEGQQLREDPAAKLEPMQDSQFSFAMEKEEATQPTADDYETRLAEKEARLKELEENRRKIVEFSKENSAPQEKSEQAYESLSDKEQQEKKFKLANIKGLKIAKSLFDDDHLQELEKSAPVQTSGSLLKNNVPTDYMEAPKPKPEFKLDLNDRIAFSQYLFNGSQSELNDVVNMLNSFTSVEKAQEFLSDIYYEKDWKKVDSYAQRLWILVENRFL